MFKIETTAPTGPDFSFGAIEKDDGLRVDLSSFVRAERFQRQTKTAVWTVETEDDLDALINAQSDMMDALFLAHPDLWEALNDEMTECRAGLRAGAATASANADTDPAEPGNSLGITF